MVPLGAFLHDAAEEVVGDGVEAEFFFDHGGALAAEDFGSEGGFDLPVRRLRRLRSALCRKALSHHALAEAQFDSPAGAVEVGEHFGGVFLGVEEGGGEGDFAGAKAGFFDAEVHQSHGEDLGEGGPLGGPRIVAAVSSWAGPFDEPISGAEASALLEGVVAHLVEAQDAIHPARTQGGHEGVGAKAAICQEHVALFQPVEHGAGEVVLPAFYGVKMGGLSPLRYDSCWCLSPKA